MKARASVSVALFLLACACVFGCTRHPSTSSFFAALGKGDVAGVQAALDQGFSPNTPDDEGWTAIHAIVDPWKTPGLPDATRVQLIRVLIQHGADPNARNHAQYAPLHFATAQGLPESVDELVKSGADVNAKTESGATPLQFAVLRSNLTIVKCLLDHGADPNSHEMTARDNKGMTALHLAARGQPTVDKDMQQQYRSTPDQVEIIKLLLAKGADPSIRDANGHTARDLAELNQQKEAMALLK